MSCGPIINTVNTFTRSSVLDFLPFMGKSVVKNTHVDDIEIENGIVKGVRVKDNLLKRMRLFYLQVLLALIFFFPKY